MNLTLITVGKIKNQNLLNEIFEIKKRINRLNHIELKDIKGKNIEEIKNQEFKEIKNHIKNNCYNILLLEHGKMINTFEFYDKLKKISTDVCFIITGPNGPNDELKNIVDETLSLSKMTFTHEMAQMLLIEQIYRVQCIEKNIPYNK